MRESGDPLAALQRALLDFADHAPARTLAALQRGGDELIREGFDRSRAPDGTPWAPLKRRPRSRPGRRPLVDTGQLRAWASHGAINGSRALWTIPRYAEVHQWGTRADSARQIPARPFLPPGVLPAHWHARLVYVAEVAAIPRLAL